MYDYGQLMMDFVKKIQSLQYFIQCRKERLRTHDANGITNKDFMLAEIIDNILEHS